MKELFKDVIGFESYFQITASGKVFSKRTGKFIKLHIGSNGYLIFATKIGGRQGTNHAFKVHRLVAHAFIPNPESKLEVNHIDGNKLNNAIENLEWVTPSENTQHAYNNGLANAQKGVNNIQSKLSEEDILLIRSSSDSCRSLARIYGVHHSQISRVKRFASYVNAGIV